MFGDRIHYNKVVEYYFICYSKKYVTFFVVSFRVYITCHFFLIVYKWSIHCSPFTVHILAYLNFKIAILQDDIFVSSFPCFISMLHKHDMCNVEATLTLVMKVCIIMMLCLLFHLDNTKSKILCANLRENIQIHNTQAMLG
jgi:hypothetical protein